MRIAQSISITDIVHVHAQSTRPSMSIINVVGEGDAPGASAAMAAATPAPEEGGHVLEQRDGARAVVPELERLHARAHRHRVLTQARATFTVHVHVRVRTRIRTQMHS